MINSNNHSVCYAGSDTWDLSLGVVLRNYQYPNLQIPKPEMIPSFEHLFGGRRFDNYYTKQELIKSSGMVHYNEIKRLPDSDKP